MEIVVENTKMKEFIDEVYHTPYLLFTNNCMHKSIKIVEKARGLGLVANLVFTPISIVPRHTFPYLPIILPHCYVMLEREQVNVAQDPDMEQIWCKNSEVICIAPLDISETRRAIHHISLKENTLITLGKLTLIWIIENILISPLLRKQNT